MFPARSLTRIVWPAHLDARWPTLVGWGCRLSLAGVFVMAALPKMSDPAAFATSVQAYQLLPSWLIAPVAIVLPWMEAVLAAALVLGTRWRWPGLWLSLALLVAFTLMLSWAWYHALEITCGCFTTDAGGRQIGPAALLRNALLLGLCAMALKLEHHPRSMCEAA